MGLSRPVMGLLYFFTLQTNVSNLHENSRVYVQILQSHVRKYSLQKIYCYSSEVGVSGSARAGQHHVRSLTL
jgi:hypothetical protein